MEAQFLMKIHDVELQLYDSKEPATNAIKEDVKPEKRIIENALKEAEKAKFEGINDLFFASVKRVWELSEPDYFQVKARYGKISGLFSSDLDKATKVERGTSLADEDSNNKVKISKADMLIELIHSEGTLFHCPDDEVYISFTVAHSGSHGEEGAKKHTENWRLRSRNFKSWASYLFYSNHGTTPGDAAINEAVDTLTGIGLFDGDEIDICSRYAFHKEKIYVDLGCSHWKVVEISTAGFVVLNSNDVPVKFTRSNTFREIPKPIVGGNISLLWEHLNIDSEDIRHLCLAWIFECMRVNRPYPVLEISGEQGSAKSTFQKCLKEIIDPNKVDLRSAPRDVERIFVSTQNNHLLSYNNLSHLTVNVQDAFCTLSTGGGDASRKLYSDSEEQVFEAMRPVMMNGITQLATRPDLGDRTIALQLPRIKNYKTELELSNKWNNDLPQIMGALYALLSQVLAELPKVKPLSKPPRMADFAYLGQAMLNVQEIDRSFSDIFINNRDRVVLRAIESSPVAQALIKLIDGEQSYIGTKGGLMDKLVRYQSRYFDRSSWPKSVQGLMNSLNRIAPALRVQGIEIIEDKKRYKDGYRIKVLKIDTNTGV